MYANILKEKCEWKTTFCRPRQRWEYSSVKMDFKYTGVVVHSDGAEYSLVKVTVNIMRILDVTSN